METKTIVVDVDDCISTHTNRDYENALPHVELIDKLNRLYDMGWEVVYFTSRGMVSCNGDVKLIEELRGPVLERWMDRHGVKRTRLQFGKPLGVFYLDDKAIRPDEFMDFKIETLGLGRSGASVTRMGSKVLKKGKGTKEQHGWFQRAANIIPQHIPRINCFYDDVLDMEYVENDTRYANFWILEQLADIITSFARHPAAEAFWWDTMVRRVRDHAEKTGIPREREIVDFLDSPAVHQGMNSRASFCHGDMTLSNCLYDPARSSKIVLIDPNTPPALYQSYVLDAGKVLQSCMGYERSFLGVEYEAASWQNANQFLGRLRFEDRRWAHVAHLVAWIRLVAYQSEEKKNLARANIVKVWEGVQECF